MLRSHFLESFRVIPCQDSPRGRLWTESAGFWATVGLWPPSPARSPLRRPQVLSVVVGPAAVAAGPKEQLLRSRHRFGLVPTLLVARARRALPAPPAPCPARPPALVFAQALLLADPAARQSASPARPCLPPHGHDPDTLPPVPSRAKGRRAQRPRRADGAAQPPLSRQGQGSTSSSSSGCWMWQEFSIYFSDDEELCASSKTSVLETFLTDLHSSGMILIFGPQNDGGTPGTYPRPAPPPRPPRLVGRRGVAVIVAVA